MWNEWMEIELRTAISYYRWTTHHSLRFCFKFLDYNLLPCSINVSCLFLSWIFPYGLGFSSNVLLLNLFLHVGIFLQDCFFFLLLSIFLFTRICKLFSLCHLAVFPFYPSASPNKKKQNFLIRILDVPPTLLSYSLLSLLFLDWSTKSSLLSMVEISHLHYFWLNLRETQITLKINSPLASEQVTTVKKILMGEIVLVTCHCKNSFTQKHEFSKLHKIRTCTHIC